MRADARLRAAALAFVAVTAACAPLSVTPGVEVISTELQGDWLREERPLGAGIVTNALVRVGDGGVRLAADGALLAGSMIRSRELYGGGAFRASMRCNAPRGAVCAFFLYEPDAGDDADEIDIELIAGTRELWLTTWVAGQRTNHVTLQLDFDPAHAFHEYEIRWGAETAEFVVDDRVVRRFDMGIPRRPMALYANAWFPTWLERSAARGELEIRRIGHLATRLDTEPRAR